MCSRGYSWANSASDSPMPFQNIMLTSGWAPTTSMLKPGGPLTPSPKVCS